MPFIELHISHASEADPQPILVNTANICFLYTMLGSTESGTIIRSGKDETFFATETYEEIKSLILQARKPAITGAMVLAWGARHDLQESMSTMRAMIDDARSIHLSPEGKTT